MLLIGALFYIFIILTVISLSGDLRAFVDFPSFSFVLLSNISILITTKGTKDFLYGIKLLVLKNVEVDKDKIRESIEVLDLLKKSSFAISLIGVLIGLISMMTTLDDPSSLGIYMAVILLVPFYSIMLNLIIITPAKFMLEKIYRKLN